MYLNLCNLLFAYDVERAAPPASGDINRHLQWNLTRNLILDVLSGPGSAQTLVLEYDYQTSGWDIIQPTTEQIQSDLKLERPLSDFTILTYEYRKYLAAKVCGYNWDEPPPDNSSFLGPKCLRECYWEIRQGADANNLYYDQSTGQCLEIPSSSILSEKLFPGGTPPIIDFSPWGMSTQPSLNDPIYVFDPTYISRFNIQYK